jgi:hypothetical protein
LRRKSRDRELGYIWPLWERAERVWPNLQPGTVIR